MITKTYMTTTPSIQGAASGFGMPMCGHQTLGNPVTGQRSVDFRSTEIARVRVVTTKGFVALAAVVPGLHAWSPPI